MTLQYFVPVIRDHPSYVTEVYLPTSNSIKKDENQLSLPYMYVQMEITNDVQFLLPIMAAIMVAKWVGDFVTHPLYHALLELKCIPFLDAEPVIVNEAKKV